MNEQSANNSKVYYDWELLRMIQGLDGFYYSRSWYIRWWFKPWHDALQILALQLCWELLSKEQDYKDAVEFVEGYIK